MTGSSTLVAERLRRLLPGSVQLDGVIGQRMQQCMDQRLLNQDVERLVLPFRIRNDGPDKFRGEFWGKWFTGLVLAFYYQPNQTTRSKMDEAIAEIGKTQSDDGCISTYDDETQHGHWDVWSRKYVLLGLVHYYQETGDESVLSIAKRMVQHFQTQVGPGKINLGDTGHWAWEGLAPNSILEPIALLYQITGDDVYKESMQWIVDSWKRASQYLPNGLRLVDAALAGTAAQNIGNYKAYEQMSCFEGLYEAYRATGEQSYFDACVALAERIRDEELTVVGSGSNHECWFGGKQQQTEIWEQALETCVTVTWIKLCYRLLKMTGNVQWADEMEKALYNALSASVTPDGSWWSYYSPLIGERVASHYQFEEIGLSCCVANGPRALMLSPQWAIMQDDEGPIINLYESASATIDDQGRSYTIHVTSNYPYDGQVKITLAGADQSLIDLRLRIPDWSKHSSVHINGDEFPAVAGRYKSIKRVWLDGDELILNLDMRAFVMSAPSGAPQLSVQRGPLVLALDNRLNQASRETYRLLVNEDGSIDGQVVASTDPTIAFAFEVPCEYHRVHIIKERHALTLCDYASAGNAWSGDNLFRVWMPQPLFMEQAFVANTWKLMYPDMEQRPDIPSCRNDFDES